MASPPLAEFSGPDSYRYLFPVLDPAERDARAFDVLRVVAGADARYLRAPHRLVLAALAAYLPHYNPTIAWLADATSQSKRTVQRAIRDLESLGVMRRFHNAADASAPHYYLVDTAGLSNCARG